MAAIPKGPLGRPESLQIARMLQQRIRRRVGLEVWTRAQSGLVTPDRDANPHVEDTLALMRQVASLHPALSVTPYDMDRFAERAAAAKITLSPTVVVRGPGRAVHTSGLFYGPLFAPFLEVVGFASVGGSPVSGQTRAALQALDEDIEVETFISPFDPMSPQMALLVAAFGVETKHVRVRIVEASQFPVLAAQRLVDRVPVTWINGRRFEGFWSEADLAEQVRRVATGEDEPVIRERILNAEYMSEEAARQLAAGGSGGAPQPSTSASGLILPGQT